MKKNFLIAAVMLITLGACTQDETNDNRSEIGFKAVNYKNVKSAIIGVEYPNNISFGVFAYYSPSTETWATNHSSAKTYMNNIEVAYSSNIYKPVTKYYWPNEGSLTFIAYSPYSLNTSASYNVSDRKLTISDFSCGAVTNGDFTAQKDLMYSQAKDATAMTSNGSTEYVEGSDVKGVQIKFHHALSQIRFSAKPFEESSTTQFNILKIELAKINNKGTMTVTNDDFEGAKDVCSWVIADPAVTADFVTYDQTAVSSYDKTTGVVLQNDVFTRVGADDNNLLVIPQGDFSDDVVINVTYRMWVNASNPNPGIDAGINTKSVKLNKIITQFDPNKIYNLNFTISADAIQFAPEIVSWDASTDIDAGDLK